MLKPNSTNPSDYEILIRKRGENNYASYCPSLLKMITGTEHEVVYNKMKDFISYYIQSIESGSEEVVN